MRDVCSVVHIILQMCWLFLRPGEEWCLCLYQPDWYSILQCCPQLLSSVQQFKTIHWQPICYVLLQIVCSHILCGSNYSAMLWSDEGQNRGYSLFIIVNYYDISLLHCYLLHRYPCRCRISSSNSLPDWTGTGWRQPRQPGSRFPRIEGRTQGTGSQLRGWKMVIVLLSYILYTTLLTVINHTQ